MYRTFEETSKTAPHPPLPNFRTIIQSPITSLGLKSINDLLPVAVAICHKVVGTTGQHGDKLKK